MRTLFSASLTAICLAGTQLAVAGAVNLPGDMPAMGGHYLHFDNRFSEWQNSGSYLTNSTSLEADDRVTYDARSHGNRWQHTVRYVYGLSEDWAVGVSQGYAEARWHRSVNDDGLTSLEGSFEQAGETDLTLIGQYRLAPGAALITEFSPSTAGANPARSNTTDTGQQGDAGRGYSELGLELAANWVTELGTQWLGSVRLDATTREKVNGHGVSGPWCLAMNFGSRVNLSKDHHLVFVWHLMRGFSYKRYNASLETEASYGDQSQFALNTQYQWDLTAQLQLQSYVNLAMTQPAIEKFSSGGQKQRIELSGGTETTLGFALKAEF